MSEGNAAVRFGDPAPESLFSVGTSLGDVIGTFALERLEERELTVIAEKLFHGVDLSEAEALSLANVELPYLGKLVEIVALSPERTFPRETVLHPCVLIPLAKWIENAGVEAAESQAVEHVKRCLEQISWDGPLSLFIDRWFGAFSFRVLVHIFGKVCSQISTTHSVIPVGPSTAELSAGVKDATSAESRTVAIRDLLKVLRNAGVHSIEGGSDLDIHGMATDLGFRVAIGQELFANGSREAAAAGRERELISALLRLADDFQPSGNLATWFPFGFTTLDRAKDSGQGPLGLQHIRAIAIGRILLPRVPYIRASVSFLGRKVAHVALAFGANDLGYAAVDAETTEALGISRLSESLAITNFPNPFRQVGVFRQLETQPEDADGRS